MVMYARASAQANYALTQKICQAAVHVHPDKYSRYHQKLQHTKEDKANMDETFA